MNSKRREKQAAESRTQEFKAQFDELKSQNEQLEQKIRLMERNFNELLMEKANLEQERLGITQELEQQTIAEASQAFCAYMASQSENYAAIAQTYGAQVKTHCRYEVIVTFYFRLLKEQKKSIISNLLK